MHVHNFRHESNPITDSGAIHVCKVKYVLRWIRAHDKTEIQGYPQIICLLGTYNAPGQPVTSLHKVTASFTHLRCFTSLSDAQT